MLKENTINLLNRRAYKEVKRRIQSGENTEVVMIPIVISRDTIGNIKNYTTFDNLIIPEENKQ